ncbi:hypothetical protein PFMALIP_01948 [Plasmodium falciparum MaliPS096_E11]|uniref:Surface antigen n=1 Tax=Plasmodium falciparum MaliPS096_E11 TaxID=1036727 RepID=A0A024WS76_PLAFA|nr:hypothetical protein PFMALIP_01948 [Plasmodium falciparum MaliPS096_E11]
MKVHYINILLFALPLNILVGSPHKNPSITPNHPSNTRLLCDCELYAPSNYDNDPEMKEVMEIFDRQTSQRFEEYNERIIKNRQKYKEQRDKNIQKIIHKDKMEKNLAEKIEKGCLMCGCVLGGGVLPVWGLVGGLWYATWSQYVATTLVKMATDKGIAEGVKVGLVKVTEMAKQALTSTISIPELNVGEIITVGKFTDGVSLDGIFKALDIAMLGKFEEGPHAKFSTWITSIALKPSSLRPFTEQAQAVSNAFNKAQTDVLAEGAQATSSLTTGITASIIAIVVIVLVMIIIYLVLRYRRKKKMKKKAQYTKLLNE